MNSRRSPSCHAKRRLVDRTIRNIEQLAPEFQLKAFVAFFGCSLREMERDQIERIRRELRQRFGDDSEVLELIDGHLALRDMFGADRNGE